MLDLADVIQQLTLKQQELLKTAKILREENAKMKLKLQFLEENASKHRQDMNEYEFLKKKVEKAIIKIERLIKKIDTAKS
ncbi:MAG: hypothetical protein LBC07_05855 [Elusimicrobiota bacterium]|jgi:hypothetical protein|nr:hypothetical protein [Elusimicrobiota bacterium]